MTDHNTWQYLLEEYPKDANVSILALDSKYLFSCGGAVIPTFMWAVEADGRIGDTLWMDFNDPVLNLRSYFDNRSLEQLLLADRYFNIEWHLLGKDSEMLTSPAGFDKRFVHKTVYNLYEFLFSRLAVKPSEVVVVPEKSRLDVNVETEEYKEIYLEKISLRGKSWTPENLNHQSPFPVNYGDAKSKLRGVCYQRRSPATPGFWDRQQFYAWPEIYFRKAIGVTGQFPAETFPQYEIKTVHTWFAECPEWGKTGCKINSIDTFSSENERAWDVTERVYQRWRENCKGVTYGIYSNDNFNPGWLGFMIRNRYFGFYDTNWVEYYPRAADIARSVNNRHVLGTGDNHNHAIWDYMCMLGIARRKVPCEGGIPSIARGMKLNLPEPDQDNIPWQTTYSSEQLMQFRQQNKIGVSLLWGIPEISYNSIFPNMCELHKIMRGRCGFGTYLPWIEYYPHWYTKLFSSVYSLHIEPMLFGGGTSKFFPTDAIHKNFNGDDFKTMISFALNNYRKRLGEAYVPKGYLASMVEGETYHTETITFADSGEEVKLWEKAGMPSPEIYQAELRENLLKKTEIIKQLGFKYYFGSSLIENIVDGDFTRIGTVRTKTTEYMNFIKQQECVNPGQPAILAMNFDSGLGFKLMSLLYEQKTREQNYDYAYYGIFSRANLIQYIATGGDTGRLIPMRPCELVEYYRLIASGN